MAYFAFSREFNDDPDVHPDDIWKPGEVAPSYVFLKGVDTPDSRVAEMYSWCIYVNDSRQAYDIVEAITGVRKHEGRLPKRVRSVPNTGADREP